VLGVPGSPVVVKPKTLAIDKRAYNMIRSFVESSVNPKYSFNIGVCRGNVAVFRKKSKWRLTITPKRVVLRDHRVSIHVGFNSSVEVDFGEQKLRVRESELKEYDVVPDAEIPYARPISLYDFIEKIIMYYEVAQDCW
jgi:hypothetical protein